MMVDDFGGLLDEDIAGGELVPSNVIPFPNMRANPGVSELWGRELAATNNRLETRYRFLSPLDALDELMRKRSLPSLPWPSNWNELAKRALLYIGECIGVVGPSGGGKTSFAIQVARAAAGDGIPVLWAPLELDAQQIDLRIVANMAGVHTAKVRDAWERDRIAHQLAAVSDLWRYVDRVREPDKQIAAFREGIRMCKRIYRRSPLLVIDYIGKMASLERDPKLATRAIAEQIRELTLEEECYTMLLAQPSRQNTATLTGKTDIESAADAMGVASDSGEIEHACAVMVALNVFKVDDAVALDAHVLVSKARGSGLEGREGFRFSKPGGVWSELGYLPATPTDVKAEVKRAKKDKSRTSEATPERARADVNAARAGDADAARRRYVREALEKAGMIGMTVAELRKVRGTGRAQRLQQTLQELERAGDVARNGPRWRFVPGGGA